MYTVSSSSYLHDAPPKAQNKVGNLSENYYDKEQKNPSVAIHVRNVNIHQESSACCKAKKSVK